MTSGDHQSSSEELQEPQGANPPDFEELEARIEKLEQRSGCLWVFAWVVVGLMAISFIARLI